jgi:uncharacterized membrane protein
MTTGLLLAIIVIAAVVLWLIPMDATLRKVLLAVVVVAFFLWLIWLLGAFDGVRVGPAVEVHRPVTVVR